ncbi:MAG: DUF6994 family protein [Thermomicrobiales bacterium]
MDGIDVSYDVRTDANGRDPDSSSPTLRRYHQLLWSKPLPSGAMFALDTTTPGIYLHHRSSFGEFSLASDSVMATFTRWLSLRHIVEQFPEEENEAFRTIGYTIGGMMVFPGNRVDGRQTINGARGFTRKISDRMDLTLECIRRHYLGGTSPLAEPLRRYSEFFALFESFCGYVDFFLLQDMVSDDYETVRFFMPFDDFRTPAVPGDVDTYREFRRRSMEFTVARNARIAQFSAEELAVR